jgi:hypothetical protein
VEQVDLAPQVGQGFETLQTNRGVQESRIQGVKGEAKVEVEVKGEADADRSTSSFFCAILSLRLIWRSNLKPS